MTLSGLEKAENERANHKMNIAIYNTELADHPTTPLELPQLEAYINSLETMQTEVIANNLKIRNCTPTDMTTYDADCAQMVRSILKLNKEFTKIKNSLTSAASGSGSSASSSSSGSTSQDIRLPRLELPTFSGDPTMWLSFYDQFTAAVHNNPKLSDSQRMTYLKSSLKGDAAKVIGAMTSTDANYSIALKSLTDRFQNNRELVFSILKKFVSQPVVQGESAKCLRTLIDVSKECVRSLEVFSLPVKEWDVILSYIILQKVDSKTRQEWELDMQSDELPKFIPLLDFLEQRARAFASSNAKLIPGKSNADSILASNQHKKVVALHVESNFQCKFCGGDHLHMKCTKFISMTPNQRRDAVKESKLCLNCLRPGHYATQCNSKSTCSICKAKHHSLLHIPKEVTPSNSATTAHSAISYHATHNTNLGYGMLATAVIKVMDKFDRPQLCRAFLDGGATSSFITEACAKRLGLPRTRTTTQVNGIASASIGIVKGVCNATFKSYYYIPGDETFSVSMLILPVVTNHMPSTECDPKNWTHLKGLQLADDNFFKPGKVDILLGSDIFWSLLVDGKRTGPKESPYAVNSKLGWLVAGTVGTKSPQVSANYADVNLESHLQKFWELEAVPTTRVFTPEERKCEEHFRSTFSREENGRFVVSLPFKPTDKPIGVSRDIAVRRLLGLEKRLIKQPQQHKEYNDFLNEYISLGHMELVTSGDAGLEVGNCRANDVITDAGISTDHTCMDIRVGCISPSSLGKSSWQEPKRTVNVEEPKPKVTCQTGTHSFQTIQTADSTHLHHKPYYIPHQYVLKPSSTTTKFRVVFDASCKSSTGTSLNDALMVGPTIQQNLFNILTRFRKHPVAFTADISKMYRQILIHPNDRDWQRILWRKNPKEEIREYRLKTVTYGTAPGSFLATRVIQQLAMEYKSELPLGSAAAMDDFYMDDLMSGGETANHTNKIITEAVDLLGRGKMELCKFSSNHPDVLAALPPSLRETQIPLNLDKDGVVKTLGLHWNPGMDVFIFQVNLNNLNCRKSTKRTLLSEMSRTFDPLGWISPVTIRAKILFQQMWKSDAGWDDPLPDPILHSWNEYKENLPHIEKVRINRCISVANPRRLILHGFADASERAYAAVVYLKVEQSEGPPVISIVAAKTKVAPVKPITLPRLELCGAVILVKLLKLVQDSLKENISEVYGWTDSTVALSWILGHPSRWKTFVANRVTEIQEEEHIKWGHVPGVDNPADCASRGINPSDLPHHPLWWSGPSWLSKPTIPSIPEASEEERRLIDAEEKQIASVNLAVTLNPIISKYSTLCKLTRATAYFKRFIEDYGKSIQMKKANQQHKWKTDPLGTQELHNALLYWVRVAQQESFGLEIKCLEKNQPLPNNSKLRKLSPFLDLNNIIRVGGRLTHANVHSDQKNPMLLPKSHKLTELVIQDEHLRSLHGGPQLMLSNIQRRFWILNGKSIIRFNYGKCVVCARHRAGAVIQPMASLPRHRVTPTRPFLTCGVDYAGPFMVRPINSRSKITIKAYLAIFVCFSTRAIHLEVVSSMTTDAFLAAFRRFTARRGKCKDIFSDNGSNFVGASRELKELKKLVDSEPHNRTMTNLLANQGITWHFNPPGAPHFGGLWEAGVKSTKYHLHRIVGNARLTFEELSTVMAQVEACLNSRPLTPISTDPDDLMALTPGHFLIGDSLTAIPEPDLTSEKRNHLSRWQYMQQMTQHFWRRWSKEYLSRLQQRPKWLGQPVQIHINDLILIKEENLPPMKWRMGRVTELHPGHDGVTRVVTIKTADGEVKRPIAKLSLLPVPNSVDVNEPIPNLDVQPTSQEKTSK